MHKGSSGPSARYNRVSLTRHDLGIKREPWEYRKPRRRTHQQGSYYARYERVGPMWVRVE